MRIHGQLILLCAAASLALSVASSARAASSVGVDEAVRRALAGSPDLAARRAAVEEARGRLVTARTFPFNPELEVGASRRRGGGEESTDRAVELSQEFELGGQRSRRRAVAQAELEAAEASLQRAAQLVAARVRMAFADALGARDLVEIDDTDAELAQSALDLARRRLDAGAGTDMEVNLGRASHARAERRRQQALATFEASRYLLGEVMGLSASDVPMPDGAIPAPEGDVPDLETLLAAARERRADLDALRDLHAAARARVGLARAEGAPSMSLGAFHEREEDTDTIVGVTFGIGLPVFNRNRGGVLEATAGEARAAMEERAGVLTAEREVAESWAAYRSAQAVTRRFDVEIEGSLEENLRLLQRSFEAGKIGITDVLLFRREFLESQRDHVASRADAWRARILLDLAIGQPVSTELLPNMEPQR